MATMLRDRRTIMPRASVTPASGSAVVRRGDLVEGITEFDSRGRILGTLPPMVMPVRKSAFQPEARKQTQWSINTFIWRATQIGHGMRNTGASIAVHPGPQAGRQVMTGSSIMNAAPRFTRVQALARYNSTPRSYATKASPPLGTSGGARSSRLPGSYFPS